LAKKQIGLALQGFQTKNEDSIECGRCYFDLALCYQKLKNKEEAIQACNKALVIFDKHQENTETILRKYHELLADVDSCLLPNQGMELMQAGKTNPLIARAK